MKQAYLRIARPLISVRGGLIIIVLTSLIMSCVSYQRFSKTLNGKQTLKYVINTTGATNQVAYFYPATLVSQLGGNGTFNTIINKFSLSSVFIQLDKNAGNTASGFRLSSVSASTSTSLNPAVDLFSTQNLTIDNSASEVGNSFLITGGVDKLNEIINNSIVGKAPNSGSLGYVKFTLQGSNIPANSLASITLTIELDVNIEYSNCEKVVDITLGGDSGDCN